MPLWQRVALIIAAPSFPMYAGNGLLLGLLVVAMSGRHIVL